MKVNGLTIHPHPQFMLSIFPTFDIFTFDQIRVNLFYPSFIVTHENIHYLKYLDLNFKMYTNPAQFHFTFDYIQFNEESFVKNITK